ncbi:MAG: M43 family zinc metalloprotease, partial [Nitrospinota bacterium]
DAADIDISTITDPNGLEIVRQDSYDYPLGRNWAQASGQSALSITLPYNNQYQLVAGEWYFNVRHYDSIDNLPKDLKVYYYIKSEEEMVTSEPLEMSLNFFVVDMPDYQGEHDPNLLEFISTLSDGLTQFGITLADYNIFEIGSEAETLTIIDSETDLNSNNNADDMDALFQLSEFVENSYLNIFLVRGFTGESLLGMAGGISGPTMIQGTKNSGVAINSFGSIENLYSYRNLQSETVIHEIGHFIGLFHTTESGGTRFDSMSDTPECPQAIFDTNNDHILSSSECRYVDGPNLMFWSAASFSQNHLSEGQLNIFKRSPVLK